MGGITGAVLPVRGQLRTKTFLDQRGKATLYGLPCAILAALFMIAEVMMDLIQPGIMARIVDSGVLGLDNGGVGSLELIWTLGLRMIALVLFGGLCGSLNNVFTHISSQNIGNDMRKDAFRRLMSFSFPQLDRFGTGSLVTRVTNDVTQVQTFVSLFVRGLIRTSMLTFGSIYFMFRLNREFGLIVLCALPFVVGCIALCLWKANPQFSRLQEQLDAINAIMQEDLSGIRIIKACVREAYEKARFGKANDALIATQLRVLVIFAFMNPAVNALMYGVVAVVLCMGSLQVAAGGVTPGDVMAAVTYTTQLLNGVLMLVMLFQNLSRGLASWKRVKELLDSTPELADGGFEGGTGRRGEIEFRNVSFTYPGAARPVLEHIDLTIRQGETVAVMGATGCGKTTLVNLIPRFYDVTSGAVLVDGVDVRKYRQRALREKVALAMLAVVIFGTACGVYAPSLQSNAIDIIAGVRTGSLAGTVLWMLAAYLVYSGCQLLQGLLSARLSQRIVRRMRTQLFGKLVDLPLRYVDTHSHGDVMSRMTNDVENLSTTISQSLPSLFSGVLTIIGTAAVMLWYCWQLALLSCATVLLTLLATKVLSGQVRRFSRQRQALLGRLNGTVEEMVSGYRTVVAYNHQDATVEEFCATADSLTRAGIKTDIFSGVMGPVMNCIGNIGFVIIAAFGGYFSVSGLISVGVISAFIVYAKQFSRPINELAQIYGQLQTAVAGAERVFAVLDEQDEDKTGAALEDGPAAVSFQHVRFSYVPGHPVISDFSLTVPSGQKVALVGATGSGKTTMVNLLMRFYDIDGGAIFIDGQNIRDVSRDGLRRNVAIVLQDTVLFSDTVLNNLKYGSEHASVEDVERAARMSRCDELIRSLPQGWETVLTGAGEAVSQGQRQLLAIARAFVADPRILILDEATANVDTQTEQAIQSAMQKIMERRTSIVIAHRLSTIRDADVIVVMDQGRIAEMGSHEELLAAKGKYYELYMTQYAGFVT